MQSALLGPDGRPYEYTPDHSDFSAPANNNWLQWGSKWAQALHNPDTIPVSEYERVYQTDETVFSGIQFLTHSVLSRMGEYENSIPEHEELVRKAFARMKGSPKRVFAEILTAVPYGFSLSEICYKMIGKMVGWASIQTLHPGNIWIDLHKEGPLKNDVSLFWQNKGGADEAILPPAKCIHFVHEGQFGMPFGTSRLKRAWKSIFIKDVLMRAYGTCLERYGTPLTIAEAPNLTGNVNYKGTSYTGAEFVGKMLDSMGKSGSLILPTGCKAQIVYSPAGLGNDFLEAIRYCNRSIHQAIGLPSLVADSGNTGSYSLGQQHTATFQILLENIINDLVECLIDQLIRPLIDYNFGPQEDYGDFAVDCFDPQEAKLTAEASKALIDSGLVNKDLLKDINALRERNNLLPLTEEELSAQYPSMDPTSMLPDAVVPVLPPPVVNPTSLSGKRKMREFRKQQRQARFALPLPREAIAELLPTA